MISRRTQFLSGFLVFLLSTVAFASADEAVSPIQKRRIEQITSYFENSTVEFQYAYIENLHDGRGYTAGRIGFCTGTGDLIEVVQLYCGTYSNEPICAFLPRLREINEAAQQMPDGNPDVSGLEGFVHAWRKAAQDSAFRDSQDMVEERIYFEPAMTRADEVGIQTAIGKAIFYDTIVQHGDGDFSDPSASDSLGALIARTQSQMKFSPDHELEWLEKFLDVRRDDLLHPADEDTQSEWEKSVGRVDKLRSILDDDKNIDLDRPVKMDESNSTD